MTLKRNAAFGKLFLLVSFVLLFALLNVSHGYAAINPLCGSTLTGTNTFTTDLNCFDDPEFTITGPGPATIRCNDDVMLTNVRFKSEVTQLRVENCHFYSTGGYMGNGNSLGEFIEVTACPADYVFAKNTFENESSPFGWEFTCSAIEGNPNVDFTGNVFFKSDLNIHNFCSSADRAAGNCRQGEGDIIGNTLYCGDIEIDTWSTSAATSTLSKATIQNNIIYSATPWGYGQPAGQAILSSAATVIIQNNYACPADPYQLTELSVFHNLIPGSTVLKPANGGIDTGDGTILAHGGNACQTWTQFANTHNYYVDNPTSTSVEWLGAFGTYANTQTPDLYACGACTGIRFDCRQERLPSNLVASACPIGEVKGCDNVCAPIGTETKYDDCGQCGGSDFVGTTPPFQPPVCAQPVCGIANGSYRVTAPDQTDLCTNGQPTFVSQTADLNFEWSCNAFDVSASCSTRLCPTPGDVPDACGVCGGSQTNPLVCGLGYCGDGIVNYAINSSESESFESWVESSEPDWSNLGPDLNFVSITTPDALHGGSSLGPEITFFADYAAEIEFYVDGDARMCFNSYVETVDDDTFDYYGASTNIYLAEGLRGTWVRHCDAIDSNFVYWYFQKDSVVTGTSKFYIDNISIFRMEECDGGPLCDAACKITTPTQPVCGAINGTTLFSAPSSGETCAAGSQQSYFESATEYTWDCALGADVVSCFAQKPVSLPLCSALNGTTLFSAPLPTETCAAGTERSYFEFPTEYTWDCELGANVVSCSAQKFSIGPICGDGILEGTETCEDGNDNPYDGCHNCQHVCVQPPGSYCGDGIIDLDGPDNNISTLFDNEECDDNNNRSLDSCSSTCKNETEYCGNGIIDNWEDCDLGVGGSWDVESESGLRLQSDFASFVPPTTVAKTSERCAAPGSDIILGAPATQCKIYRVDYPVGPPVCGSEVATLRIFEDKNKNGADDDSSNALVGKQVSIWREHKVNGARSIVPSSLDVTDASGEYSFTFTPDLENYTYYYNLSKAEFVSFDLTNANSVSAGENDDSDAVDNGAEYIVPLTYVSANSCTPVSNMKAGFTTNGICSGDADFGLYLFLDSNVDGNNGVTETGSTLRDVTVSFFINGTQYGSSKTTANKPFTFNTAYVEWTNVATRTDETYEFRVDYADTDLPTNPLNTTHPVVLNTIRVGGLACIGETVDVGVVGSRCGDGVIDSSRGETCDLGDSQNGDFFTSSLTGYDQAASSSLTSFTNPAVCSDPVSKFSCNPTTCVAQSTTHTSARTNQELKLVLFNDTDRDGDYDNAGGFKDVSVTLWRQNGASTTIAGVATPTSDGVGAGIAEGEVKWNSLSIAKGDTFYAMVDTSDPDWVGYDTLSSTHSNPFTGRIDLAVASCQADTTDIWGRHFAGFYQPSCGDGFIDVSVGEQCDLGSAFLGFGNNNGEFFTTPVTGLDESTDNSLSAFSAPAVCSASVNKYSCNPTTCAAETVEHLSPRVNQELKLVLFNDTDRDGNYDSAGGFKDVTVTLWKNDGISTTIVGPATSTSDGTGAGITEGEVKWGGLSILDGDSFFAIVDTADPQWVGYDTLSSTHTNPFTGRVDLAVASCRADTSDAFGRHFAGFYQPSCGDGFLDASIGEQCDLGSAILGFGNNNGEFFSSSVAGLDESTDNSLSAFGAPAVCSASVNKYRCNPTTCAAETIPHATPRLNQEFKLVLFNDSDNRNGVYDIDSGYADVDASLWKTNASGTYQIGSTASTSNGAGFGIVEGEVKWGGISVALGDTFHAMVNTADPQWVAYDVLSTTHPNPFSGRVNMATTSCRPDTADAFDRQLAGFYSTGGGINTCGDGFNDTTGAFGPVEQCDDNNNIDGDGCSASCVIEYCGDGIPNNVNEQCDFGTGRNDNIQKSLNQIQWDGSPLSVCSVAIQYTCNTCQFGSATVVSTPSIGEDLVAHVFNDTDGNALSDDGTFGLSKGINGMDVALYEEVSGVRTLLGQESTTSGFGRISDSDFTVDVYTDRDYYFVINISSANYQSKKVIPTAEVGDNEGRLVGNLIEAQIPINAACSQFNSPVEFGFVDQGTPPGSCMDGTLDFGETCDWGPTYTGGFSSSATSYIPFENLDVCQPAVNRYSCDLTTCQLTTAVVSTPCPGVSSCTNSDFVVCTENSSAYVQRITYTDNDSFVRSICGHDGFNWGWQSGIADLDSYETTPGFGEICAGGINSIDQNCNAHKSFTRFGNGSVNYGEFNNSGVLFSVYRDVDAFDATCAVNVSGTIVDGADLPIAGVAVDVQIVSPSGPPKSYVTVTTNATGQYSFTGIPATRYVLSPYKVGYNAPVLAVNLTTYKSSYEYNFTLLAGNCRSDCTSLSTPTLCDASCHGLNGCFFYNETIAQRLDSILSGVTYFDEGLNLTIDTCEGIPRAGDLTSTGISAGGIECGEGSTLVVTDRTVLYDGRPAILKVAVCSE